MFFGVGVTGCEISSKLKVELELVYKASALLALAHYECLGSTLSVEERKCYDAE